MPRSPSHYDNLSRIDLLSAPAFISPSQSPPVLSFRCSPPMPAALGNERVKRFAFKCHLQGKRTPPALPPAGAPRSPLGAAATASRRPGRSGGGQRAREAAPAAPADTAPPPGPPRPPHTCARTQRQGAPSGRAGAVASPTPRQQRGAPGVPRAWGAGGRADSAAPWLSPTCWATGPRRSWPAPWRSRSPPTPPPAARPGRPARPGATPRRRWAGTAPSPAAAAMAAPAAAGPARPRAAAPPWLPPSPSWPSTPWSASWGSSATSWSCMSSSGECRPALPRPAASGRCRRGGTPPPGAGMRDGVPAGMLRSPSAGQRAEGCGRAPGPA